MVRKLFIFAFVLLINNILHAEDKSDINYKITLDDNYHVPVVNVIKWDIVLPKAKKNYYAKLCLRTTNKIIVKKVFDIKKDAKNCSLYFYYYPQYASQRMKTRAYGAIGAELARTYKNTSNTGFINTEVLLFSKYSLSAKKKSILKPNEKVTIAAFQNNAENNNFAEKLNHEFIRFCHSTHIKKQSQPTLFLDISFSDSPSGQIKAIIEPIKAKSNMTLQKMNNEELVAEYHNTVKKRAKYLELYQKGKIKITALNEVQKYYIKLSTISRERNIKLKK